MQAKSAAAEPQGQVKDSKAPELGPRKLSIVDAAKAAADATASAMAAVANAQKLISGASAHSTLDIADLIRPSVDASELDVSVDSADLDALASNFKPPDQLETQAEDSLQANDEESSESKQA